MLEIWYVALLVDFYLVGSNKGPRFQVGPAPGGPRFKPWIYIKILKNLLLQSHFAQMFEIRYVALSSGILPSLIKQRSLGPSWSRPKGSYFLTKEIHRKLFKNFLLQEHLAQMLEI